LNLTILGTGAAYSGPGQACSGLLIRQMNTNILIDCGTGVLSNLQKCLELDAVSDIIISHMHADHFIDLIPYRYALRYGFNGSLGIRPQLYLPPGGIKVLDKVVSPFSESDSFFADVFDISEFNPEKALRLGNLDVKFVPVLHYIQAYAVSVSDSGKIAYSSDTGLCSGLANVAQDADILVCNVGRCLEPDKDSLWGHLRPSEAGTLAREARVRRLLLTHLWPRCNRITSLREAAHNFAGLTELAEECHTYHLGAVLASI
jgi:ribonuclease BN (tRNA processing enzyme)